MVINHNMSSMFANRQLGINNDALLGNIEKLSSGEKINRAGDDASGLAVSEKMRSQIRGLNQANRNVNNGISFIQTTEGYLQETTDILQRIREFEVLDKSTTHRTFHLFRELITIVETLAKCFHLIASTCQRDNILLSIVLKIKHEFLFFLVVRNAHNVIIISACKDTIKKRIKQMLDAFFLI